MKPAFALDFRDMTLGLLHRTGAGWAQVGSVALDDPDLTQALGYLRSTALGLSPRGISTKLIIPNDQILYLTVAAPGPDAAKRRAQIAVALEGRTPYDVADLVFDWSGSGGDVQVAVIARETLAEAAGFAAEHRFNPVSFVAVPDEGSFKGEPWFGPTDLAADLLAPGEKVDRDKAAVVIVSRAYSAEAAVQPRAADGAKADAVAVAVVEPDVATVVDPAAEPVIMPVAEPTPDRSPEQAPAPTPAAPDILRPDPVEPPDQPTAPQPPETLSFAQIMAEAQAEKLADPAPVARYSPPAPVDADEAPMALDVQGDDAEEAKPAPTPASVLDPRIDDDLPPEPSPSALIGFSSRRQGGDDLDKSAKAPALAGALASKAVPRPTIAKPIPASGAAGMDRAISPMVARPSSAAPAPRTASVAAKPSAAGKALRGLGALVTAPGIAGSKMRKPPVPQIAGAAQTPMQPVAKTAATAPTRTTPPRSGIGLGGKPAPVRGKPRFLGLALTLILLLCLVLVAAWSSYYVTSWQTADPAPDATVDASPDASDFPAPEDEMAADMQDPADFAVAEGDPADMATAEIASPNEIVPDAVVTDSALPADPLPVDPLPATEIAADLPPAAAEPAPQTGLNAGVAAGNTPNPEPQDEILLATMDAPPIAPDPLSLPQPDARGDPQPATPPAPPPYGTVYQFDADGMIIATPEGIITPEGVLLIAGKPPLVPAARPETLVAAAAVDPALAVVDPAAEPALPVDPALVGKRSKPRPAGLAPVTAPEDDAALAPATDSRFAGLRPRLRAQTVLAAGEAERLATAAASLTATADDAATSSRSPLAVAISRKPEARPRDLSRAVEAAVAIAVRNPEPEPEPAAEPEQAAAAPEKNASPEADNEPELASAAPNIPTKASVAKQATFKNAINLSKINLIGVYGTQSSRYALVRQANGRYKKVKVGDKIDGGQIAAITATEVRYKKGSKMVTLAMPKG